MQVGSGNLGFAMGLGKTNLEFIEIRGKIRFRSHTKLVVHPLIRRARRFRIRVSQASHAGELLPSLYVSHQNNNNKAIYLCVSHKDPRKLIRISNFNNSFIDFKGQSYKSIYRQIKEKLIKEFLLLIKD